MAQLTRASLVMEDIPLQGVTSASSIVVGVQEHHSLLPANIESNSTPNSCPHTTILQITMIKVIMVTSYSEEYGSDRGLSTTVY
eukprot:scaffold59608_cov55-Attheya_sp.AAC.2